MKSFIAIILAFAFLFQSSGKLIVVVKYALNKEFISKVLCENKAKPILKCNGKCHLKKELQKEEKKENAPANNSKEKFEVQFSSFPIITDTFHFLVNTNELNVIYLHHYSSKHIEAIFHPPQA